MKNPGMIIVDEEHDNSLKQQEGFRYSARDLAVARGKHLAVPVILGTATPSLESLRRCKDGAYQHLRLPARAGNAAPPLLRLVDLNLHPPADGISDPVIAAIRKNLQAGGQTLVYLNRRGFAPTLICGGCSRIAECERCDARMTVHASSNELRCHHCGASRRIDNNCSECGGNFRPLGEGTERLEDALKDRFPEHAIARIDSDSVRLKGTMNKALSMATTGETRILIGTQMLSKGHHFPNLTLVVVVNADQGLFSTDFRGSEKLAQSLVQVSGRAGRERRQGEVLIQTAYPAHPFWAELFGGGYERVAESALEERSNTAWPPYSRLALIRASAHKREDARAFLKTAVQLIAPRNTGDIRVLGPVSAPMERRAGRYRAQLLLQSVNRQALQRLLQPLRLELENERSARRVRWSVDVDPIELF
jgi:primosomal protein N' (replication factor Y)